MDSLKGQYSNNFQIEIDSVADSQLSSETEASSMEEQKEIAVGIATEEGEERPPVPVGDEDVLKFTDSMDSYLTLLDSLSSILRQGWLDLASARHSMGGSRINGAVLDLKLHSAATSVQVNQQDGESRFILRKWASADNGRSCLEEQKYKEDKLQEKSGTLQLRYRGNPQVSGERNSENGTPLYLGDQVQKERAKSLSMFGTLVSPKLRATQMSFETAMETLVQIANTRSAMLSSFDRVQKQLEISKKDGIEFVPPGIFKPGF